MYAGIWEIDLHGKNEYQARVTLDAALRRVRPGTYRIRVIHGHHGGTALRELVRREYGRHPQVLRLEAAGPGVTELVLRQRAVDNQLFTVGTAPARDESGSYVAWGHSMVCEPWGGIVHQCGTGEEVAVTELELSRIDAIRRQLPILSARRTDLYEVR